jgi:hypothetical protein
LIRVEAEPLEELELLLVELVHDAGGLGLLEVDAVPPVHRPRDEDVRLDRARDLRLLPGPIEEAARASRRALPHDLAPPGRDLDPRQEILEDVLLPLPEGDLGKVRPLEGRASAEALGARRADREDRAAAVELEPLLGEVLRRDGGLRGTADHRLPVERPRDVEDRLGILRGLGQGDGVLVFELARLVVALGLLDRRDPASAGLQDVEVLGATGLDDLGLPVQIDLLDRVENERDELALLGPDPEPGLDEVDEGPVACRRRPSSPRSTWKRISAAFNSCSGEEAIGPPGSSGSRRRSA